jgi:EAL domain-containing protein (putative c-di-GMP-specific phosphodiesterase class I)
MDRRWAATADEVRHALDRGEFRPHFMPIATLADRTPAGYEALARWHHAERGVLRPGAFLAAVASAGIDVPFGWHILEAVCSQLAAWNQVPGIHPVPVNVNVDPRQFAAPDFVARWEATIAAARLSASAIHLEAPRETLALPCAADRLSALRAAGIGVLFDDALPGDEDLMREHHAALLGVKLDHHLASDLVVGAAGHARLGALAALARAHGLLIVAEAVQTEAQWSGALALGCHQGQGDLFGPTLDGPATTARLRDTSARLSS